MTNAEALHALAPLQRTRNYPQTPEGIRALADGLKRAAERHLVKADAIVRRCAELSEWCPTDADLLRVAEDLRPYVPAKEHHVSETRCLQCHDSGWRAVYTVSDALGAGRHSTQFEIPESEVEAWWERIRSSPNCSQRVYETSRPCGCRKQVDSRKLAAGDAEC